MVSSLGQGLTRTHMAKERRYRSHSKVQLKSDLTGTGERNVRIRQTQVRVIKKVVPFASELQVEAFMKFEVLHEPGIYVPISRTKERITTQATEREWGGRRECGGIKPLGLAGI